MVLMMSGIILPGVDGEVVDQSDLENLRLTRRQCSDAGAQCIANGQVSQFIFYLQ